MCRDSPLKFYYESGASRNCPLRSVALLVQHAPYIREGKGCEPRMVAGFEAREHGAAWARECSPMPRTMGVALLARHLKRVGKATLGQLAGMDALQEKDHA